MNQPGRQQDDRNSRAMDLLWGGEQRPSRGPKPSLTRRRVVDSAIAIADAEGLEAVSMQRIADQLDVTKMAMYRYVPGKSELAVLMVDTATGPPPELKTGDTTWRSQLEIWAARFWDRLVAHPWVLGASIGLRPLGPNELSWMNSGLEALSESGLDGAERLDAIQVLSGHVRALAQQTLATSPADPVTSEAEFTANISQVLAAHGERFPALRQALAETTDSGRDNALQFGLARILDGIAVLIAERTTS